jgi:hypothetical protein
LASSGKRVWPDGIERPSGVSTATTDAPFISRRLGADVAARPIADWVLEKGQIVDPVLRRSSALGGRRSGMRLYDLRPGPLTAVSP